MKKIFYWSPFLSNIATIDAVVNSIKSIQKYDEKNFYEPSILDACGEWQTKNEKLKDINVIQLYKKNYYNLLPKGSYFKSRLSQFTIFILSFISLKKKLKKEKPDYIVAHLIISLPLLLFFLFDFKSKLIIRISGTPKLNPIRKFFWSLFSRKVFKITCPTYSSSKKLLDQNIFPYDKVHIVYDPIINVSKINYLKKERIDKKFLDKNYILSIGRLTKQKNYSLLIEAFKEIKKKYIDLILIILGNGEEKKNLENLISNLGLSKSVFLEGHKKNVFNYIYNCESFISSSIYEDPGFVLVETGFLNKTLFAADSNTGPSEILNQSNNGFLFENKNKTSLINNYFLFKEMKHEDLYSKKLKMKKYTKNFTLFSHFQQLKKIFN